MTRLNIRAFDLALNTSLRMHDNYSKPDQEFFLDEEFKSTAMIGGCIALGTTIWKKTAHWLDYWEASR